MQIQTLGNIPYNEALLLQTELQEKRINNEIDDTLLILEHPSVITLGKRGKEDDIILSHTDLKQQNIDIIKTDRGGQVTLHSPGQLVVYFIFKLPCKIGALNVFLSMIEQSVIHTLNILGIVATSSKDNVGIWVKQKKIASIGLSVKQRVTRHGLALNINNDLAYFSYIVPCGLHNTTVTSIEKELQHTQNIQTVIATYTQILQSVYEHTQRHSLNKNRV